MRKDHPEPTSDVAYGTAELKSYNPLVELAEAAAASGCRVTLTIDINPPEPVGATYERSEKAVWERTA